MAGAEAGLVLGLISAVITICEAAHEIWEAVEDQSGLTKSLQRAAEELPLAATSLEQAKVNLNAALRAGTVSEATKSAIEESLRSCKESADYVMQTFREYLPTKDDQRKTRISKAYTLRRRSSKIQEHVQHIMRGIETLAQHQVLHDAQTLEDIKAAIEELELSDNDESKLQSTESGDINNLSGNATLRKNVNSSSGKQYVSTESSVQHIAENMYMGKVVELNSISIVNADLNPSFFKTSAYASFKDEPNPPRSLNTCMWFLEHRTYVRWLRETRSNILWLSAGPGSGKSVLSKTLVDEILPTQDSRCMLYFFFKDNSTQDDACVAVCALLHQLFCHQTILFDRHATPAITTHGKWLKRDFEALWNLLMRSATDPDAGDIICLLDGLDECKESDQKRLISKLEVFYKTRCLGSVSRDYNMKFLVTSRPYTNIIRSFAKIVSMFPSIKLDGEAEKNNISTEIDAVIRQEMVLYGQQINLSASQVANATATLLSRQNTTYLWASFVLEEIHEKNPVTSAEFAQVIRRLPASVEDAYEKMLSSCPDQKRALWILSWIVAGRRPFTLEEMDTILAIMESPRSYEEMRRNMVGDKAREAQIRHQCRLFVAIIDSKVLLIHQTAYEFLIRKGGTTRLKKKWQESLKLSRTHEALGLVCISLLLLSGLPKTEEMSFQLYAKENWAEHFCEADVRSLQHPLAQRARILYYPCNMPLWQEDSLSGLDRWVAPFFGRSFSTLELVCYHGHHLFLEQTHFESLPKPALHICLHLAARNGHGRIVDRLIEAGARVDSLFYQGTTPLEMAASNGHLGVVRSLIKAGADVNATSDYTHTALHSAQKMKHSQILEFLLESGADESVDKCLFVGTSEEFAPSHDSDAAQWAATFLPKPRSGPQEPRLSTTRELMPVAWLFDQLDWDGIDEGETGDRIADDHTQH